MKTASIPRDLERQILTHLASGKSVATAAQCTGLSFGTCESVAVLAGYPDRDRVRAALDTMRAEDARPAVRSGSAARRVDMTRELRTVRISELHPDPDNPREDLGDVTELAESIRETGLLQPIVARERAGRLIIVAGHRRHAALRALGQKAAHVLVIADMRPDEVLAAMIIENGQRRDLDPIEEARAYQRLKKARGVTSAELGEQIGRSQATIDGRLRLLDLSPEDQEKIRAGEMGIGHGTLKSRVASGRVRQSTADRRIPHLATEHDLAGKARARCSRVHKLRKALVGHTACGECWESVIRADERHALSDAAAEAGATCGTCGRVDQPGDGDLDTSVADGGL